MSKIDAWKDFERLSTLKEQQLLRKRKPDTTDELPKKTNEACGLRQSKVFTAKPSTEKQDIL